MSWVKFPNQIEDMLKLRSALLTAAKLAPADLRDDGVYGDELLSSGLIHTKYQPAELHDLPNSRQPQRTTARILRQFFILLGCMVATENGVELTAHGRVIAESTGATLTPTEIAEWLDMIVHLHFPHPAYPDIANGVADMRPATVMLAMLEPGPVPSQGLALAFAARDESAEEIERVRGLALTLTPQTQASVATAAGTTIYELRNNAKVFPGLLEQIGLIRRENGQASITAQGLSPLGIGIDRGRAARAVAPARRQPRAIAPTEHSPWTPDPLDPEDLVERAALRLIRLERATLDHQAALRAGADFFRAHGFDTFEADYDILARRADVWLLIEVKSLGSASVRSQTTAAIGQLAYYAALSLPERERDVRVVRAVLYDREPGDERAQLVLENEDIGVMWVDRDQIVIRPHDLHDLIWVGADDSTARQGDD